MEALYLLIPLSVAVVFGIVVVLWWATTGGQFDDLDGPGHRILMDDDQSPAATEAPAASEQTPFV